MTQMRVPLLEPGNATADFLHWWPVASFPGLASPYEQLLDFASCRAHRMPVDLPLSLPRVLRAPAGRSVGGGFRRPGGSSGLLWFPWYPASVDGCALSHGGCSVLRVGGQLHPLPAGLYECFMASPAARCLAANSSVLLRGLLPTSPSPVGPHPSPSAVPLSALCRPQGQQLVFQAPIPPCPLPTSLGTGFSYKNFCCFVFLRRSLIMLSRLGS